MRAHIIALTSMFLLLIGSVPTSVSGATVPDQSKIKAILSDPGLWGEDFNALLANVKAIKNTGETKIEVFSSEAVGATPHATIEAALHEASELRLQMQKVRSFKSQFRTLVNARAEDLYLKVAPSAHPSRDDESGRVVLLSNEVKKTSYFPSGLTLKSVTERHGAPEKVTKQLIDTGDERRPIVLTLYHYGDGAIMFAQSDLCEEPETIERVILDTAKVSAAIF